MSDINVIAGVVTFNPDLERLRECIDAILEQIPNLYIVDNGSHNIDQIESFFCAYPNTVILSKNTENKGIATALAQIMNYAKCHNYSWVLTMDQDSVLQPNIINEYIKGTSNVKEAGMFTCLINDRNFTDEKYEKQDEMYKEVDYCITSAAFTNVDAYEQTSGYDESFFIDCVDFDICYSLREKGYSIIRVNHVGILHEVGNGENRRFFWKKIVVYHEKPMRIYYLARNTKRLYKKHDKYGYLHLLKTELALLVRILLYEDNRLTKLKFYVRGLREA